MKSLRLLKLLTLAFFCLVFAASCVKEGPMGPAGLNGEDGADGVDGSVTCLVCHSGTNMEQKQAEFAMSEHSVGAIAVDYAGGQARCAPCHSHEQFVQVMTLGGVVGDITSPSAWVCQTCHGIHETFEGQDYALRTTDPIKPYFNSSLVMDLNGTSNLCANCHQSRRGGPSITNPGEETFKISNTHWGPHHGPQANVVAGIGFEEIPGSITYPDAGNSYHLAQASCTGCHMADFSNGQGGHSFIPSVDACNDCHNEATIDDYNYGGVQTDVHELLIELRDLLMDFGVVEYSEEGEWVWNEEKQEHELVDVVGEYLPHPDTYPTVLAQAFYNWIGLEEDRSLGVHNPKYVKALLMNTIEALENLQ